MADPRRALGDGALQFCRRPALDEWMSRLVRCVIKCEYVHTANKFTHASTCVFRVCVVPICANTWMSAHSECANVRLCDFSDTQKLPRAGQDGCFW